MAQSDPISFITLNDIDAGKIYLNPSFIVMMTQEVYEPEEGVEIPFTDIHLSSGQQVHCIETVEQIFQALIGK